MAQYFEPSTDTNANFANSVAGQTNSFFLPAVYSKKVLNFFRKASVAEAITNTDYEGEISAFGDSVRIIKEPVISVSAYTRGSDTTATKLTDQEISLVVDTANAFKFIVDDIETSMSHVNFKEVAASSAAYALRDAFDAAVIAAGFAGLSTSSPDHTLGTDSATHLGAGVYDGSGAVGLDVTDPLDLLAKFARLLDEQNVPEEGRWLIMSPHDRHILMQSDIAQAYFTGDQSSIVRTGKIGMLDRFTVYVSNLLPKGTTSKATVAGLTASSAGATLSNAKPRRMMVAGTSDAVSFASQITKTEPLRNQTDFGDIVRGLSVYGRKVVKPEALVTALIGTP